MSIRWLIGTLVLAGSLVAVAHGSITGGPARGVAPGILVFSGMTSGSYLHAMRPDGTELRSFALPKTCSPAGFTSGGNGLVCIDVSDEVNLDRWRYFVKRNGSAWGRVSMPAELKFPDWANPFADGVDAPQWSHSRDRIAFIRPAGDGAYWFSSTGEVVVADADGSNKRVVAVDGEAPHWSPDDKHIAFSRCRVFEDDGLKSEFGDSTAECSLWTVAVDGPERPERLVKEADSDAVWSPDGRFIAVFRQSRACETVCRYRILIVPSAGGDPFKVGPELVEPSDKTGWWNGLAWLPGPLETVSPARGDGVRVDELELQRCVDIWNRARMYPWPTGAVNVSLVRDRCQVTVSDYGAICTQTAEMRFRFWCPSHGAGLGNLPPEYRVWNAQGGQDGEISLFDKPKEPRLAPPSAPPYPMLDGYVIPYGKDDLPLADLKLIEVAGTCDRTGLPGYPLAYPDRYSVRCFWHGFGGHDCFKHRGQVAVGDTVLCPNAGWEESYDPMSFVEVKVVGVY